MLLQVCASLLEDGDSLFKMLAPDSLLVGLSIALVVRARPATSLGIPCRSHCVELIQGLRIALFSAWCNRLRSSVMLNGAVRYPFSQTSTKTDRKECQDGIERLL